MSEHDYHEGHLPGHRLLQRMNLIWAGFFYLSLGLGLVAALFDDGINLQGWPLVMTLVLVGISAALFQGLYYRCTAQLDAWPMKDRIALAYFAGQMLVLVPLLSISHSFVSLGFAVIGQCFGVLRPRNWIWPLLPLGALMAWSFGDFGTAGEIDWLGLAFLGLSIIIWLFVAGLLSLLFHQRARLLALVRELHRARAQLEAAAAQQEELAVLRERTRLAREMHDSIGHALVSVNVKLEAAQRLYRVDMPRGDNELETTRSLVRETMAGLRRSIADLRAPPDHHDLPVALSRLADEVQARSAVNVQICTNAADPLPTPMLAEAFFLITREALLNVERHAQASSTTVQFAQHEGNWVLEVADNGIGLRAADMRRPGHFGIAGMRERTTALGGSLQVAARAKAEHALSPRSPIQWCRNHEHHQCSDRRRSGPDARRATHNIGTGRRLYGGRHRCRWCRGSCAGAAFAPRHCVDGCANAASRRRASDGTTGDGATTNAGDHPDHLRL